MKENGITILKSKTSVIYPNQKQTFKEYVSLKPIIIYKKWFNKTEVGQ